MSTFNNSVFDDVKNGLELPRISSASSKQELNGKEVNIQLKNNYNKMPKTNGKATGWSNDNFNINLIMENNNAQQLESKSKSNVIGLSLKLFNNKKTNNNNNGNGITNINTNNKFNKNHLNISENMDTPSAYKVAVRMRPLSENEKKAQKSNKISDIIMKDSQVMLSHKKEIFEFDYCLDSTVPEAFNFASQEVVYQKIGKPALDYAFQGYNVCLLAYGQSGSGKTYTMLGTEQNPGIIQRFLNELFRRINSNDIVDISFLEIYNEKIHDLLSDEFEAATKKLRVREDPETGPFVEDLKVYTVENYENAMEILKSGMERQTIASTNLNDKSNRSHTIFNIYLIQKKDIQYEHDTSNVPAIISKIHFVDLAGSEKAETSNGVRFRESTSINKSLLTLGNVMKQLYKKENGAHISYRDSILTYLLKDSLGGNSRTSMIATISPAKVHLDETLNTLRYASNAQKIVNVVHINDDPKITVIRKLLKQISFLKKEVDRKSENDETSNKSLELENNDCNNNSKELHDDIQNKFSDIKHLLEKSLGKYKKLYEETECLKNQTMPEIKEEKFEHNLLDKLKNLLKSAEMKNDLTIDMTEIEKKIIKTNISVETNIKEITETINEAENSIDDNTTENFKWGNKKKDKKNSKKNDSKNDNSKKDQNSSKNDQNTSKNDNSKNDQNSSNNDNSINDQNISKNDNETSDINANEEEKENKEDKDLEETGEEFKDAQEDLNEKNTDWKNLSKKDRKKQQRQNKKQNKKN